MDSNELKKIVSEMLGEGISLSDIQKTLENDHNHKMTYMDLRILSSELEVDWTKLDGIDDEDDDDDDDATEKAVEAEEAAVPGETVVSVSKIARPGVMLHGDVVFKSGIKAGWQVIRTQILIAVQ